MTIAIVFAAGAAYAGGLWLLATSVARRRALVLGGLPVWTVLVCGAAAVISDRCFAPALALQAALSLIGAIVCALVDARTGYIFDALTLSMAGAACALALLDHRLPSAALAAAVVGGAMMALYLLTRRRGIGLGDVKLGSAIAVGYGLEPAVVAVGSAFIIGALYAGIMIGLGRAKRSDALRFGPFIAGGAGVGFAAGVLGWAA